MSNFFNQEEINKVTITETPQTVTDFSYAQNQNKTLGELAGYNNLQTPDIKRINLEELANKNKEETHPVLNREFKKQADKDKALIRARVKLFVSMFLLITMVITGFVVYNIIALIQLNNKVDKNEYKIRLKQEEIEQEQSLKIDNRLDFSKDIKNKLDL